MLVNPEAMLLQEVMLKDQRREWGGAGEERRTADFSFGVYSIYLVLVLYFDVFVSVYSANHTCYQLAYLDRWGQQGRI